MVFDVSFVITVYNKAAYLPATIASMKSAAGDIPCQYIFVDDVSTDASLNVIRAAFHGQEDLYCIITNDINAGPSIRLNQGVAAASGEYVFLMDADDLLVGDALAPMLHALKQENADFIFGGHQFFYGDPMHIGHITLKGGLQYTASHTALDAVLSGKYVRMSYLVKRESYMRAHGCDERLFIQDESLPLRLACASHKMLTATTPCVLALKADNSLSHNVDRQHRERFYAHYFLLKDHAQSLTPEQSRRIFQRAISSVWKAKKKRASLIEKTLFFFTYLHARYRPQSDVSSNLRALDKHLTFMGSLT